MIIDAHAHLGPAFRLRPPFLPGVTGEEVVAIMDRAAIDIACVFAPAWEGPQFIDPEYREGNRAIYEATRRFPKRLVGYVRVDPNVRGRALDEMRRGREKYGFRGLKLHPLWEHFQPNNLRLMSPIMELCGAYRWPIFFHAGYYPTCQPAIFIPLAERFPEVPIILGHIGYAHVADVIIAANLCPNIYVETSANSTADAIQAVLERVDPRQILYGSDLPFTQPEDVQAKISLQPTLTDEARPMIMGGNMARLLGIENELEDWRCR